MTKDEALKLALEALEAHADIGIKSDKAINAIKEALAQPNYRAVKTYHEGEPVYVAQPEQNLNCKSVQARLATAWGYVKAQSQQEPVAWMHNFIEGGISIGKRPADLERHPDRWTALFKEPKPCPTCEALARTVMLDQTSHDAGRTWVGLIRGVRVEGNAVVIKVKGGNDAARELCGALIEEMGVQNGA